MERPESLSHISVWPIIEGARRTELWLNRIEDPALRAQKTAEVVQVLDERWPHYDEYFNIIGRCFTPADVLNPYDLDWIKDERVSGLSKGFCATDMSDGSIELCLLFSTHHLSFDNLQKQGFVEIRSMVSLREPFTVVEHEDDLFSAIQPESIISQQPDEHFSFRRYREIGHRFIYAGTERADEDRKRKVLDYVRQRWPYGECDMSVSAEYAYQLVGGEHFFVDLMHLFAQRQPIRGTLLDFGFYPHRLTSDSAIKYKATKFGAEALSLLIEPDEPELYSLRPNGVLVVPTSQRLAAVVHDLDQDIVIQ